MISRPAVLAGVVALVLATPLAAGAEQAEKVYRIGLFHVGLDHVPPALYGLRQGLKELGYEEGKNLRWDFRNLPDETAAQATAREFVRQRVLLVFDPADPVSSQELAAVRAAANGLQLQVVERAARTAADIERVFTQASHENIQAVIVVSGLVTRFSSLVIRLAGERHLAISGHRKEWTEQGALFSYGADYFSVGRIDAARLVDRMLKGTKPAALPVERIARLELVINLRTAKALGLTIPQSLLQRADKVIE